MKGDWEMNVVITKQVHAPQDLVFSMWTDGNHLLHWWGSPGVKLDVVSIDVKPGGLFHYKQTLPDGQVVYGKFTYHKVESPNKLAFTSSFADEQGETIRAPFNESWPIEILNTLSFSEENGETTIEIEGLPFNATEEERAVFQSAEEAIKKGFSGTFAQLEAYIENIRS
jgi:uncharacterized protein YndB with AHSA1/START domain